MGKKNFTRRTTFHLNTPWADLWVAHITYIVPAVKRIRRRPAGVRILADGQVVWFQWHPPERLDEFGGGGAIQAKAKDRIVFEAFGGAKLDRMHIMPLGSDKSEFRTAG